MKRMRMIAKHRIACGSSTDADTVAAVLAVRVVVLLVVGDEVAKREAVVGGDEVDGCHRAAAGVRVQVG